jgi:hypothetical protein
VQYVSSSLRAPENRAIAVAPCVPKTYHELIVEESQEDLRGGSERSVKDIEMDCLLERIAKIETKTGIPRTNALSLHSPIAIGFS